MIIIRCLSKYSSIAGITILPFILLSKGFLYQKERLIRHEKIHIYQQIEMFVIGTLISLIFGMGFWSILIGYLFFYVWYVLEWIIKTFIKSSNGYKIISFELEAYSNDKNVDYLKNRKPFSWIKYLFTIINKNY